MSDEFKPTIRRPNEQAQREADPFAEQRAYFAKYELLRQQKVMEQRRNSRGLSIYERARQEGYPDWMKDN